MGLGQLQKLRDAFTAFRASGKPAVVHAETFGEFAPGNGSYYLATAFAHTFLQPSGDIGITGSAHVPQYVTCRAATSGGAGSA